MCVVCRLMASKKKHLESLRNVALFSACSNKELEKVAKATDEITMTAGTMIMDQGQMGREAFVIVEGDVVVRRNGRKVATLGPGTVVGEMSLLDKGPRTATVVCETDCTLSGDRPAALPRRARLDSGHRPQTDGEPRGPYPRTRPPVLRLSVCSDDRWRRHELRRTARGLAA